MADAVCDLIVVGGGLAGLAAATRASEGGLVPFLLEQGTDERYPCNSRYTGGILHVAYQDIGDPPEQLAEGIRKAMGPDADEALIEAVTRRSRQALDWVTAHGARFVKASAVPWHRWTLGPPRPLRPGLDFPGSGPDRLLASLTAAMKANGGRLLLGHQVVAVERTAAGYVVTAETAQGTRRYEAPAVVLADGGFGGDPDLVRRFVTPRPERLLQRGSGTAKGIAVRVAEALGCELTRMDRFYGHPLSRDALHNPALWPYPQVDPVAVAGVVVDASGRRFTDEGRTGVYIANALAKLPDPAGAFVVLDNAVWESAGRESLYPANPALETSGGTIIRAGTLRELASRAGIDPDALEETIHAFNAAARAGSSALAALAVPRSGSPRPLENAPFMAIPMVPGITTTFGGIRVDAHARALARDGRPVPGLYAVGASAGGLEGGEKVGYVGGLMRGLTSGLAAAEHAIVAAGKTVPVAATMPPAAAPIPARPSLPVLRFLARHGTAFAATTAALVAIAAGASAATASAGLAIAVAALAGGLAFIIAKGFAEMAALVLDALVPH